MTSYLSFVFLTIEWLATRLMYNKSEMRNADIDKLSNGSLTNVERIRAGQVQTHIGWPFSRRELVVLEDGILT